MELTARICPHIQEVFLGWIHGNLLPGSAGGVYVPGRSYLPTAGPHSLPPPRQTGALGRPLVPGSFPGLRETESYLWQSYKPLKLIRLWLAYTPLEPLDGAMSHL